MNGTQIDWIVRLEYFILIIVKYVLNKEVFHRNVTKRALVTEFYFTECDGHFSGFSYTLLQVPVPLCVELVKTNQTKHFKCSKQFQINPFAHTKTQLSCPWQCSCLSPFCNTSNPLLCVSIIEFYHTPTRINFVCIFICRMLHSRASPIYLACLSTDGLNWINCMTG